MTLPKIDFTGDVSIQHCLDHLPKIFPTLWIISYYDTIISWTISEFRRNEIGSRGPGVLHNAVCHFALVTIDSIESIQCYRVTIYTV